MLVLFRLDLFGSEIMATQAIRFEGPPGLTLTLDVATLASDTLAQTGLTCLEATNRKGLYTTATFVDALAGRFRITLKTGGVGFGSDQVTMTNTTATFDADSLRNETIKIQRAASEVVAGAAVTKTNTSESPSEVITEVIS